MCRNFTLRNGDFAQVTQPCKGSGRKERNIAKDGQPLQPGQPIESTFSNAGNGIGNGQLLQICTVGKGSRTNGRYGVEQVYSLNGAVHEGLVTDGERLIVMIDRKIHQCRIILEHTVCQTGNGDCFSVAHIAAEGTNVGFLTGVSYHQTVFINIQMITGGGGQRVLVSPYPTGS